MWNKCLKRNNSETLFEGSWGELEPAVQIAGTEEVKRRLPVKDGKGGRGSGGGGREREDLSK